ncbi:hypothetical protein BJY01DRAFT_18409 [Aspergillus pseudoustus]|uniref:Uncharacterized protein n=1 Tax=Aspergillus pseudoustus TaxID=1810923 RepID=A0ABR4KRM1_9EURO
MLDLKSAALSYLNRSSPTYYKHSGDFSVSFLYPHVSAFGFVCYGYLMSIKGVWYFRSIVHLDFSFQLIAWRRRDLISEGYTLPFLLSLLVLLICSGTPHRSNSPNSSTTSYTHASIYLSGTCIFRNMLFTFILFSGAVCCLLCCRCPRPTGLIFAGVDKICYIVGDICCCDD